MRKYTWVVLTNCDPAHEADFNTWYDQVHLHDLLRIPGVVGASRAKISDTQMTMTDNGLELCGVGAISAMFRYMALYHFETEDVAAVLQQVKDRSGTPDLMISPYLTEAYTTLFEDLS